MKETHADEFSTENLDKGKNTYGSEPLTYRRTRTIEEIEEEERLEKIAENVGLMGTFGIIGIPKKDLPELSKSSEPFRGLASRYAWMLRKEDDE